MMRSHSFAWILVSLLSLTLAAPLQADITPSGDVDPTDHSWWIGGGYIFTNAYIGKTGAGSVTVNLGSDLSSYYGLIGYYSGSTGVVTVDGSGSTWTNSSSLCVGRYGQGTLNITNGGAVSNSSGHIGDGSGSTGVVTVDGSGSTWTCGSWLYVGYEGTGTLNITNGGVVDVGGTMKIWGLGTVNLAGGQVTTGSFDNTAGGMFNFTGGAMTIDGGSFYPGTSDFTLDGMGNPTLILINGATTNLSGTLTIGGTNTGTLTLDGGSVTAGSFDNSAGGTFNWTNGTLGFADSLTIDSATPFNAAGGDTITENRTLEVANALTIGASGTLTLDGGSVTTGSFDNTVGGTFNWTSGILGFSDGLTIDSATPFNAAGADGDKITASRTLEVANNLTIGGSGTGTLNIQDGGSVSNTVGYIGYNTGSTGVATVDGSGSTWTNSNIFCVGYYGQGTLNITNGGAVSNNSSGYIGYWSTGVVTVDGIGSTWNNSGDYSYLYVGYEGQGTLNITNGGAVSNTYCRIGYGSGSTGVVAVDGSGSTWTNNDSLYVGYNGQGTLDITNGGAVISNDYGYIGLSFGSTGVVTVDGNGSTWTNSSSLYVGRYGQGTLNITNDGAVSNSSGYIGYSSGSTGEVTVDGSGSTWANSSFLYVGYNGQGTLNITNGGAVSNANGNIGNGSGSTSVVTVDGSGSTWTNSGELNVGYSGQGTLNITNGGAVSNGWGYIGTYSGSTGVVTVDGSGSTWTNSVSLYVGGRDGQGTLNITGGGAVSNSTGYIGREDGSTGEVTVDGSGSTWTNSGDLLVVGYEGTGTLNITNGGLVSVAGTLTIDNDSDGNGFINMATGGMLALYGDADDSLTAFMGLINGTDAIRYWDDSILDWADITGAIYGDDYTLSYLTAGDLADYTVLTVTAVPEPASAILLLLGALAVFRQRRKP